MRKLLLTSRNRDGGWPYVSGKASRLEPTCWALLALALSGDRPPDPSVLRTWPRKDGWLEDVKGAPVNIAFNALAALTLWAAPEHRALAEPIVRLVIAAKGIRFEQSPNIRLDASLQAWGWVDGTASWVEPTAWALLLLKTANLGASAEANERIRTGDRMLIDRVCREGGWNYGNSNVYGQDLWPYVPTTALALLALQDRPKDPIVEKSLQRLREDLASERSLLSLALSVIAFRAHHIDAESLIRDLVDRWKSQRDGAGGGALGLATSLYALSNPSGGGAFAI
jgi:hypothetical protein